MRNTQGILENLKGTVDIAIGYMENNIKMGSN
jgi:hypothetical protein